MLSTITTSTFAARKIDKPYLIIGQIAQSLGRCQDRFATFLDLVIHKARLIKPEVLKTAIFT